MQPNNKNYIEKDKAINTMNRPEKPLIERIAEKKEKNIKQPYGNKTFSNNY